ncbi:hypothetical protein DFQ29_007405, partial [Apophysomyces sp. BC1021]
NTSLQCGDANYELQGGLTTEEVVLFDEIADTEDIDGAIAYIQKKKYKLSEGKKRGCREYIMLSLVEKVLEDMELWSDDENEQEITYYRRAASLLDILFKGTDIMLTDGETASYSSKIALEMNKCLFNNVDASSTYPRKIDLLLEYDRKEKVELSSNEWKKARVSANIALSQQIRNLKVNATIINKNQSVYSSTLNRSLVMDFVGCSGYLYILEKLDDVFVAKTIGLLVLPKEFAILPIFKNTLKYFFMLKDFYCKEATELKKIICTRRALSPLNLIADSATAANNSTMTNLIFFKPAKKRKRTDSEDNDEEAQPVPSL